MSRSLIRGQFIALDRNRVLRVFIIGIGTIALDRSRVLRVFVIGIGTIAVDSRVSFRVFVIITFGRADLVANGRRNFGTMLLGHIFALLIGINATHLARHGHAGRHQFLDVCVLADAPGHGTAHLLVDVLFDLLGLRLLFYTTHSLRLIVAHLTLRGMGNSFAQPLAYSIHAIYSAGK